MLIGLFSFLLITPLIIYYLLENTGKFDTRSIANSSTELNSNLKLADLDSDNKVSLTDFVQWRVEYRRYKLVKSGTFKADLDNDGKVGMLDLDKWLSLFKEYKKYTYGLSVSGTIDSGKGLILTYALEEGTSWKYEITGDVPDGCHNVEVDVRVSKGMRVGADIVYITATIVKREGFCTEAIVRINEVGHFEAGKESIINFFVTTTERNAQGIYGYVRLKSGNCMPTLAEEGLYSNTCNTTVVSRKVYIRELTNDTDFGRLYQENKTRLIGEVQSDSNGYYELSLSAGKYSVFVEDNGQEWCYSYSGSGEACAVTIEDGIATEYNITIHNEVY